MSGTHIHTWHNVVELARHWGNNIKAYILQARSDQLPQKEHHTHTATCTMLALQQSTPAGSRGQPAVGQWDQGVDWQRPGDDST